MEIAKYLVLKCGANINLKNSIGDSPLDIAQRGQNPDLLVILSSLQDQSKQVIQHEQLQQLKSPSPFHSKTSSIAQILETANDTMNGISSAS